MAQVRNFFLNEMKDALLLIETGDIIKQISIYEATYGKINGFQIFLCNGMALHNVEQLNSNLPFLCNVKTIIT